MARSWSWGSPEPIRLKKTERHTIEAVVDRLGRSGRDADAAGGFGGDGAEMGRESDGGAQGRDAARRPEDAMPPTSDAQREV